MNSKRLLALLLAITMCFLLAACPQNTGDETIPTTESTQQTAEATQQTAETVETTAPEQSGTATPLLYRVSDENGNVVWLFGSIHVGKESYYPLPQYVLEAFEGADSLAVELDLLAFEADMNLQMAAIMPLVYVDGSTIKDHLPAELYEQSVQVLKEYNSYIGALDLYCPAFWATMIESVMIQETGADANLGIDRHLLTLAKDAGKEILEIESAKMQYAMLAGFDADVQQMMLESAVECYEYQEEAAAEMAQLMQLWETGNESALNEYFNATDETMTQEEKAVYEKYNQAMVADRNNSMAQYAENALASGKEVFICVGAAHIVGDGAVADLLSQLGYTVERIPQ